MKNGIKSHYKKPLKQCIKAIICLNAAISVITLGLYSAIPSGKIMYNGEQYTSPFYTAVSEKADIVLDSSKKQHKADISLFDSFRLWSLSEGDYKIDITTLGFIPIKTMAVSVIPQRYLIPDGRAVGIKLNTGGITVVSVSEETDTQSVRDSGIAAGDIILAVNDAGITDKDSFCHMIDNSNGNTVKLTINRNGNIRQCYVTPTADPKGGYRLGLWLKEGTSGIGTLTFYDPESKTWGALGHGITDEDTGEIANAKSGTLLPAGIISVEKSKQNLPGELKGYICEDMSPIGNILSNNSLGVYGTAASWNYPSSKPLKAATRDQVKEGKATILASIDGNTPISYEVEIEKLYPNTLYPNKGMLIKVTDRRLLKATGGIVQGMSGSPIIQNGKLIGAVTHVFVNDPTRGYGIFIENMLDEAMKVN